MQTVGLDEDEAEVGAPVPTGAQRARAWAVRRPARTVCAVLVVVVALAAVVLGVPRWARDHERDRVLGAAPFAGAVHPLDSAPGVRWSAVVDGEVAPVLVGDVVVTAAGEPGAGRRLEGLDVVDGGLRWSVPLDGVPVAQVVLCRDLDGRLACVIGPRPPSDRRIPRPDDAGVQDTGASTLLLLDPADGTVLARRSVDGWVVATGQSGRDLVVATYAWGMLTVRRLDPSTGEERWETERWTTFQSAGNSRVRLVTAGDLITATGNEVTLVLDAATGERLPRPEGSSVSDETRLLEDGTLVRTRYRMRRAAVGAVSELSTGWGAPWLTVRGSHVPPAVSDGTSGLVFAASGLSGGPLGGRVRAYRAGDSEPVWRARPPATDVAVDAAGRVVLRGPGALVGLDASTGQAVWRESFDGRVGRTFSDGQNVVVEHESADGVPSLTALALDDGVTVWETRLPVDAPRARQIGGHLYAVGDDVLVALR